MNSRQLAIAVINDLISRGFMSATAHSASCDAVEAILRPVVAEAEMTHADRSIENKELAELHAKLSQIAALAGVTS